MTSDSHSARFIVLDASGSNWHTWQTTAKFELRSQKYWGYLDPTSPTSSPPARYSAADQAKIASGDDPILFKPNKDYLDWFVECDVAIARLARLVDPIHVDILDSHPTPKACWDALVVRFANHSAQGVALLQTKLAALRFADDDSTPFSEFLTKFSGLVLDLRRAGHALSDSDICTKLALALPMSLQPTVSSLQEGINANNPTHWYASLATTWERLKTLRTAEPTYVNRAAASSSRDTCHVCHQPGHFARDCPTLTPEERAQRQERARKRKQGRSSGRPNGGSNSSSGGAGGGLSELNAQLAAIQARIAALEVSDSTSSGYDTHAKVSVLCASTGSLSEVPRVCCVEHGADGGIVLKTGGGKLASNYAAVDSGASRHCAAEHGFFVNYRELEVPQKVYLGDDRYILAIGEGDFRLWVDGSSGQREGIVFSRTLHVPDLACTLISIRQLTRETTPAVHAVFRGNACEVRNDAGIVFRALADDAAGGLYVLKMRAAPRSAIRSPVLAMAAFTATKSQAALDPHIAHARFGHLNCNDLHALVRKQLVSNLSLSDRLHQSDPCEPCLLAKAHKLPFSPRSSRSSLPLDLVHTDVCGPMDTAAVGGFRYFVTFRDDCTRLLRVYLLRKKSDAFERYKEFKAWAERSSGRKVGCLMSDRGGEFMSNAFESFLRDTGTVDQTSSPYTPEQNGAAERVNRDLKSTMRAVLQDSGLATRFWGEAILYAAYTLNFRPNSALDGGLPYTAWTGNVPDVSHLRSFGCDAYVLIQPDSQRKATGPTAAKCIFTGYTGSGYRCWDPKALRFRDSRHVVCVERNRAQVPSAPASPPSELDIRRAFNMVGVDGSESPHPSFVPTSTPPTEPTAVDVELPHEPVQPLPEVDVGTGGERVVEQEEEAEEDAAPDADEEVREPDDTGTGPELTSPRVEDNPLLPLAPPEPRRGTRIRKPNPNYTRVSLTTVPRQAIVPANYAEAMACPEAALWTEACNKEINTLIRKGTFRYVRTLPPGRKALKGMFVFAIKVDGTYKARLVVKGCAQRLGQDYDETFSPVARSASIRMVVSIAVRDQLVLYAADFTAAFLNGTLEEEIYMEQPPGWSAEHGKENWPLMLVRSLYGLKQAGRVWYTCLTNALNELGFSRLDSDPCVYMRRRDDSGLILIAVHVDDLTGAARDDKVWADFCAELNAKYELKNLGRAKEILGLEIAQDTLAGTASITQSRYILDLSRRHGVYDLAPLSLPLPPKERFSIEQCPASDEERASMKQYPYLALVGALLFVSCQTRPDIAHAVCTLARFSANPARVHWDALLGVLLYLRHSSNVGLSYARAGSPTLSIYSDADWGMCPDTYKSTTGWLVMLSGGPISWSSKRQSVVAQSTMEAEYVAMSMACREGIWARRWLAEIDGTSGSLPPTPVFCDNVAAISITKNPESYQMTKHIAIRYHFVRDQVQQGEFAVYHVPSRDQLADFLMKPASKDVFLRCRARAGVC